MSLQPEFVSIGRLPLLFAAALALVGGSGGQPDLNGKHLELDAVLRGRVGGRPPDELTSLDGTCAIEDRELRMDIRGIPVCVLPMTRNGASLELTRGASCPGLGTLSWSAVAVAHETGGYPRLVGTLVFSEPGATGEATSMVVRWLFVEASKHHTSLN